MTWKPPTKCHIQTLLIQVHSHAHGHGMP